MVFIVHKASCGNDILLLDKYLIYKNITMSDTNLSGNSKNSVRYYINKSHGTVVGANLCIRGPLEVNGKGIRGVGAVADKEIYTVHTINITSQQQYFVAHCLISYVSNVWFT
jgi:hypothetical protein